MSQIITDIRPSVPKINVPFDKIGMGKFKFIDKDERGKIIDSPRKSSKSVEVEGDSRFCGKRFYLGGKLYGDKRCLYCGVWFHWKDTDYQTWVKTGNIDRLNIDDTIEPLHCGSAHCTDYHHIFIKAEEQRLQISDPEKFRLYKYMQSQGMVD